MRSRAAGGLDRRPHLFRPGDGDAPTLLLLHGTGGDERDLLPLADRLAPGATVFSPRGTVLERGMPRFFARYPDGSFDAADLADRTEELADLVDEAATRYGFDRRALVALGYSNGANIAASLLLRRPETLAAAALLRAVLPFEPDRVPGLDGKRVFLASGSADPYAPEAVVARLVELLRAGGADVERFVADAGHGLTAADLAAAEAWFGRSPSA